MNFYTVTIGITIGTATITLMASDRKAAIHEALRLYRENNNLPTSFDLTSLYRGCEVTKFQPGDKLPA